MWRHPPEARQRPVAWWRRQVLWYSVPSASGAGVGRCRSLPFTCRPPTPIVRFNPGLFCGRIPQEGPPCSSVTPFSFQFAWKCLHVCVVSMPPTTTTTIPSLNGYRERDDYYCYFVWVFSVLNPTVPLHVLPFFFLFFLVMDRTGIVGVWLTRRNPDAHTHRSKTHLCNTSASPKNANLLISGGSFLSEHSHSV